MNPLAVLEAVGTARGVQRVTLLRDNRVLGRCGSVEEGDFPDRLRLEQLERFIALGDSFLPQEGRSVCAFLGSEVHQLVRLRDYKLHVVLRGSLLQVESLVELLESTGDIAWKLEGSLTGNVAKNWNGDLAREHALKAARELVDKIKVIPAGVPDEEPGLTTEADNAT